MKVHSEGKLERSDERALIEAALRTAGDSSGSGSRSSPFGAQVLGEPLIAGYTIVREIHRGGQGVVYQAVRESTGRTVAIKVMREGPFAGLGDRDVTAECLALVSLLPGSDTAQARLRALLHPPG